MIPERKKKLFLNDGILSRFSPNGVDASLERYEADSSNNQGAKYEHAKARGVDVFGIDASSLISAEINTP